jgi:hypothetical protein
MDLEASFEYKGKLFMLSICSKSAQGKWVIMMRMEKPKKFLSKHQLNSAIDSRFS